MNGKELAQLAKRVRPGIKVLLTSGYAFETLAERGHLDPAFGVLNKPYRRADLARRIREVMEGR